MPGAFVHLLLASKLCSEVDTLDRHPALTRAIKLSLTTCLPFCQLGAVSPDAPYLNLTDKEADGWADIMHYWKTADIIRAAIRPLYEENFGKTDTRRAIAWLFGYCAHVVADLTIHPVTRNLVGDYETHEREHRVCEMYQDAYAFQKLQGMEIKRAEYIAESSLGLCRRGEEGLIDSPLILSLWAAALAAVSDREITHRKIKLRPPSNSRNPAKWCERYITILDKYVEEGGNAVLPLRGLLCFMGYTYPSAAEIETSNFIDHLPAPDGKAYHYDDLLEIAQGNILTTWDKLAEALDAGDPARFSLPNADLDTGEVDDSLKQVFWNV